MPVQVSGDNLIYLGTAEINVVGQHWNSSLEQFEPVYYYAVLDDRNVVERVEWKLEEQTATDTYRSITFEQYQTITGLYWNGSEYVTPPISILAKASTDEVNYKDQNKWLSTKLDEMEADISANETDISTLSTDLSTVVSSLTTVSQNLSALATTVSGKSDTTHNHDGAYAPATHTHAQYLTGDDIDSFEFVTSEVMTEALADKADANHNHSTVYAPISHSHSTEDVTGLTDALAGKANASHTHAQSDVTGLTAALNGKANSTHTHSQSAITGLTEALSGKADASHTHSGYFSANGGAVDGDVNVKGILRVNGNQAYYHQTSTNTVTIGTNNAVGVTVACAANGETAFNAGTVKTYNITPRNANSYLGDANSRWKGIYSQTTVNVSSDKRLKEGIYSADNKQLSDFVRNLEVVGYNYIGDDKDRMGLIAQDVIEADSDVADYLVDTDENGYYNIRPADFVFPLIASVKELWKEIERMKSSK